MDLIKGESVVENQHYQMVWHWYKVVYWPHHDGGTCSMNDIHTCIYVMLTITLQQSTIAPINWHSLQACNPSPRQINAHESSYSLQGLQLPQYHVDSTAAAAAVVLDWICQSQWQDYGKPT